MTFLCKINVVFTGGFKMETISQMSLLEVAVQLMEQKEHRNPSVF